MAKKLNELNTIDEAKSAEYNGKGLTRDADKNIFDNDLLKTNGAIDSTKLRQTAQLLEKALKAKEATSKNSSLLTELKTARTNNAVNYQVAKSQVDEGITKLESLEGSQDSNIQALMKDLQEKTAALKKAEEDLKTKEGEVSAFIKEMSKLQIKYDKAKKRREGIDKLVDKLTRVSAPSIPGATAAQIAEKWDEVGINMLSEMVRRNKEYAENFYKVSNWIETDIDYFEGRKFCTPEHFQGFIFKFVGFLKDLSKDALKRSIDGLSISSSDKKSAKDAFDRIVNAKLEGSRPKEYSEIDGENELEKEGIDLAKRIIEKESSVILKYETEDSWPFNSKDEKDERFRLSDLFTFMKKVFPRNNYKNSPLIDSSSNLSLKLADGTDIDKKKYKIKWKGEKSIPSATYTTDDVFEAIGYAEADFNWTSKSGLVKLFWDAFKDDSDLNTVKLDSKSFYLDQSGNKHAREITNFEWNHQIARNRAEDLRITMAYYVAHIKKIVEEAKDENGRPLDLTFDDKWKEAAFKVALSGRNTSNKLVEEVFKRADKKKNEGLWKFDDLKVNMNSFWAGSSENFEVSLYEDFRSESIIEEKEAELELEGEKSHLGKLASEKNDLKAKKRQAELEKDLAQKKLDSAQGKTLDQLKEKFNKIYGGGPGAKKYKWEELQEMRDILEVMEQKEGTLDSTYDGYKKELQKKVYDAISEWFAITSDWMSAEETLEKRIAKRKKNNIYYTDEKRTQELEHLRDCFDNIANVRELSPLESNERKRIDDFLNGKIQLPEDKKPSGLTPERLTELFGFTVDETLKNSWTKVSDKTLEEDNLKTIFLNDYAKGKGKFEGLISHLVEKGDIDNDKAYETGDDAKKIASWEKLLKKGPEKTIKTIVVHENDDALKTDSPDEAKKNELIKKMREDSSTGYNSDPKQNFFNKDRYGDPTEGSENVSRDQLITYLFDKKIGNIKKASEAWGKSENGDDGEKKTGALNHLKNNWYWYLGGTVLVIIVLGVIFWKQISEWWNGSAEEEGEGAKDNEKEEEENE